MKQRLLVVLLGSCIYSTSFSADDSNINIIRDDDGRAIVPTKTLVCRSEQALNTLQTAMARGDKETETWITAGACYENGRVMKFDKISEYNSGALKADGLDGRSNLTRYLCRYTYNYQLKRYVAAQQSPIGSGS